MYRALVAPALTVSLLAIASPAPSPASGQERESIFHRIIHMEPSPITEIPATPRLEEALGIQGRKVSVGDAELWVEEEGSGIPIVLINGGPGGTHHGFHPWFGRAAEFGHVIYYDQRGCGLSDYEPGPEGYSVEQAVEDLEALRKELGLGKMVLVGTSYGGFLAQYFTTTYPESVAGLVLVGAAPNIQSNTGRSRQQEFIDPEERRHMREIANELRGMAEERGWTDEEFLALLVYNNHINGDWKRQNYYKPTAAEMAHIALYEWNHDGNFNGIMGRSLSRIDLTGAFDNNPIPTLIMEGEWDLTWGPEKKHALAANHPNGRLEVFEEAGHSIFNEDPDGFFSSLKSFLEGLGTLAPEAMVAFKSDLMEWRQALLASPAYHVASVDWGRGASEGLAEKYSNDWLDDLNSLQEFLRLGFALYDVGRYQDAHDVFARHQAWASESESQEYWALGTVWRAHMLDLMDRRDEAIPLYQSVADLRMEGNWSHGQYGMRYSMSAYAEERTATPFKRIENRER